MANRNLLAEQRKAIEDVEPGDWYNGRQIISKETLIPGETIWLGYKGNENPRGGFFSALSTLLVGTRWGYEYHEIIEGEEVGMDLNNE